ncbi:MAG: pitrilysin family protein [Crocinitomicaceae bacterium]
MDRKKAPSLQPIKSIEFVKPKIFDINSNVKLFFMSEVPNETSRVDLYFDAGIIKGEKGISSFVNGLLLSGNDLISSTEISRQMDLLGGFFESGITPENAVISVYALRENMPQLLQLIKKSMAEMTCFPKEVEELVQDKKQKFQVNLQKTRFLAQRAFQENLFYSHPDYAKVVQADYYEEVDPRDLRRFFTEFYLNGLTKIAVVGNFHQDTVDEIIDLFGTWANEKPLTYAKDFKNRVGHFTVEKSDAMQSAIRVGRILFNKQHPDYNDFNILNTILGDYFGSRLMTNIREDKGYTYGIGSMVAEYNNFGYFMIATEVGKDFKDLTIVEIKKELHRLQTELIAQEELDLIKNYLLGQLLKSADGPYSMMDLYLSAEVHGMNYDFYNDSINSIRQITPQRIQELAQLYLCWEDMTVVTAG